MHLSKFLQAKRALNNIILERTLIRTIYEYIVHSFMVVPIYYEYVHVETLDRKELRDTKPKFDPIFNILAGAYCFVLFFENCNTSQLQATAEHA